MSTKKKFIDRPEREIPGAAKRSRGVARTSRPRKDKQTRPTFLGKPVVKTLPNAVRAGADCKVLAAIDPKYPPEEDPDDFDPDEEESWPDVKECKKNTTERN